MAIRLKLSEICSEPRSSPRSRHAIVGSMASVSASIWLPTEPSSTPAHSPRWISRASQPVISNYRSALRRGGASATPPRKVLKLTLIIIQSYTPSLNHVLAIATLRVPLRTRKRNFIPLASLTVICLVEQAKRTVASLSDITRGRDRKERWRDRMMDKPASRVSNLLYRVLDVMPLVVGTVASRRESRW